MSEPTTTTLRHKRAILIAVCLAPLAAPTAGAADGLADRLADGAIDSAVAAEEARRIAVVQKIVPATIAVFDNGGQGGGSGVIVSPEGLAVTNFHVVAPCGPTMKCGLPDGRFVDAVLVGIDPPGDVAVIKLIDPAGAPWPVAEWGDSDLVEVGDEAVVAGNPFLLAHDFQPTVTHGVISGTHRYQYPAGTLLEYADCLQTDASINPGNSGGPLYNGRGQLIGINGRGSFEKRGRVNVGVGYAISSNQVRRFLTHMQCGRIVDHASLGATVRTAGNGRVVVEEISESSDAFRRGLRYGDELLAFGGRRIRTANALQNALGAYPPAWRVPLTYRRGYDVRQAVVRLGRLHGAAQLEELVSQQLKLPSKDVDPGKPKRPGKAEGPGKRRAKEGDAAADAQDEAKDQPASWYQARPGFANYRFNRDWRDAVLGRCRQRTPATAPWRITGSDASGPVTLEIGAARVDFESERGRFWVDPAKVFTNQLGPPGSGGLLAAMHLLRDVLSGTPPSALEAFGQLPWGESLDLHDSLALSAGGVVAEFYFEPSTGNLVGLDLSAQPDADPCRIFFADYPPGGTGVGPSESAPLPGRIIVSRGGQLWMELTVDTFEVTPAPTTGAAGAGEPQQADGPQKADKPPTNGGGQ